MSDEPKKDEQATPEVKTEPGKALPESELDKVVGGGDKLPSQSISISYEEIKYEYSPQKE
jgi:hypothetical protein